MNPGRGGGRGGRHGCCYKCGSNDHLVKACPLLNNCYRCGSAHHHVRECPHPPRPDERRARFKGCRYCGEEGHWFRECELVREMMERGINPEGMRRCRLCHGEGHLARNCYHAGNENEAAPEPSSSRHRMGSKRKLEECGAETDQNRKLPRLLLQVPVASGIVGPAPTAPIIVGDPGGSDVVPVDTGATVDVHDVRSAEGNGEGTGNDQVMEMDTGYIGTGNSEVRHIPGSFIEDAAQADPDGHLQSGASNVLVLLFDEMELMDVEETENEADQ